MRDGGSDFQELADEAFADLLKKRKQPVGLKASRRRVWEHRPLRPLLIKTRAGVRLGPAQSEHRLLRTW